MKNTVKKVLAIVLLIVMALSLASCGKHDKIKVIDKALNEGSGTYAGKTIIVHTNDVHGAIEGYSYAAYIKKELESEGATTILVDAGDYTNGNIYVSISKGDSAVTLMNQVGYDIAALGNHEFDFGLDNLKKNFKDAKFNVLCSNVSDKKSTIFDSEVIYKVGDLKIGFFALLTPETQTKVNPVYVKDLTFTENEELYSTAQAEVDKLKDKCDIIICIAHLGVDEESAGNRSTDLYANVKGIDFVIDGHSHTVMDKGPNGEPIQSTGTEFESIGAIVIDNNEKKIEFNALVDCNDLEQDSDVLATAKNIKATVDDEFGKKFAETKVKLLGEKPDVRAGESNLGDLVADALIWSVTNEATLDVDAKHVVAITNGGGIRATVEIGDVTRSTIKSVLPFGNTIAVDYVTGTELLESLEASTFALPNAEGAFPQIAGMKITVDTTVPFDAGEEYPDSTFCAPKSIKRVTITEVNGEKFDANATYAVVTNNFLAAGGDTYYAFKKSFDEGKGFDTSIPMDEALVNFISYELKGVIGEEYAAPQGRITIK